MCLRKGREETHETLGVFVFVCVAGDMGAHISLGVCVCVCDTQSEWEISPWVCVCVCV